MTTRRRHIDDGELLYECPTSVATTNARKEENDESILIFPSFTCSPVKPLQVRFTGRVPRYSPRDYTSYTIIYTYKRLNDYRE